LLEEALELSGSEDSVARAKLLTRIASTLRGSHDRRRLEALAGEAHAIAERLDDPATILYTLDGKLAAIGGPSTFAARLEAAEELVRLARQAQDLERVYDGHEHAVYAAWALGKRTAMERAIEAMRSLVQELNLRSFRSLVTVFDGELALAQGRFAEGERLITEAFRLGERAQSWNVQTPYRLQIFMFRLEQDLLDGYDDVLRRSIAEYPGYHIFDCALARAYVDLGRRDDAREIFEQLAGEAGFGLLSRDEDWLVNLSLLSHVCAYLDDRPRARDLYGLLKPFVHLNAIAAGELCLGSVAHHTARLAAQLELHDEAEAHFELALEMNSRMGARPWFAHTQTDYAQLLLRRSAPGDRAKALMLLGEAERTYEELAMPRGVARAALLIREAGGAAAPR
jgi:tetratricopeptide (TPR) repeat protein